MIPAFVLILVSCSLVLGDHHHHHDHVHLSQGQEEKISKFHEYCRKLTNADEELIKRARKGDFADDDKLKAQLLCVAKKTGLQKEDGSLDKDKIKQVLTDMKIDNVDAVMKDCVVEKSSPEETTLAIGKCWHSKNIHLH